MVFASLGGCECLSRLALSPGLCPLTHLPAKSGRELTGLPRQENHLQPQAWGWGVAGEAQACWRGQMAGG